MAVASRTESSSALSWVPVMGGFFGLAHGAGTGEVPALETVFVAASVWHVVLGAPAATKAVSSCNGMKPQKH